MKKLVKESLNEFLNESNYVEHESELESHVRQLMEEIGEPFEEELHGGSHHQHLLEEFLDGYSRKIDGKYVYADSDNYEEDANLLENFIRIVRADMEGSYEYNHEDFNNIIKPAILKFGL